MRALATMVTFATVMATVSVDAQELTASVSTYRPFHFECCDSGFPSAVELRVTIPLSDRFALEPLVTAGPRRTRQGHSTEGVLGLNLLHRTGLRWQNGQVFVTYGGTVYHKNFKVALMGPDDWDLYPIVLGNVGVGLHWWLAERVALRPEVQVVTLGPFPLGARFVAGVSVKLAH